MAATSTSLAYLATLRHVGASQMSVLATYPECKARAFGSFPEEYGMVVLSMECLRTAGGWDVVNMDADMICERAAQAAVDDAQAMLIPDTALPGLHFIDRLEAWLKRPVLTANCVTLRDALRCADCREG